MRVLGVFAKQPAPGAVKTRLATQATPDWACAVAEALLTDTLDRVACMQADRVIVFAPPDARAWFEETARGRFALDVQADGDLGRRMRSFLEGQLERGADATVILGSDSPTLPIEFIEQAFAMLTTADVVLGPATDGGYYLLGCGRRLPPIFDGIAWGSGEVLRQTVERLGSAWRVALLPPWYDVDTLDDWEMLRGHITAMRRAGLDPGVPRTEEIATGLRGRPLSPVGER
jgi:rSAM/selenodomain-associated transferase 1